MLKSYLIWSIWLGLFVCAGLIAWRMWLNNYYQDQIYETITDLPPKRVALVFGAAVVYNNRPSAVLADRVEAAAALYRAGKVDKLLMSGDNRFVNYNEPKAMAVYAQQWGVPAEAIVLDYAGRRTYDSCYRAEAIFAVNEAILVTQRFHLPRALYLCEQFGLEGVGFVADQRTYIRRARYAWQVRETLATLVAWFDVHLLKPVPVLGDPLPIE